MSYSLWLAPSPASVLHKNAAALISRLAAELETPLFVPHVTLLGGFNAVDQAEALGACRELAIKLGQPSGPAFWGLECKVGDFEAGGTHFQCVYRRVHKTSELKAAHALCVDELQCIDPIPKGTEYVPHLSVVYGESVGEAQRNDLARELQQADDLVVDESVFTAMELQLWYTPVEDKSTKSWKLIETLRMHSEEA